MVRRGLALLWLVGAGACDAGFEDPAIVIDLRVIGIATEPAEVVIDADLTEPDVVEIVQQLEATPVNVRALVADPGADRRLEWSMRICPPTQSRRCDDPDEPVVALGGGSVADPEQAVEQIGASFVVPVNVLMEAVSLDSLAGFGGLALQIELQIWPEGEPAQAIFASKRLVVAARVPASRVANANPTIEAITVDEELGGLPVPAAELRRCGEAGAPLVEAQPGQEVNFLPVEPEGVREAYVLPTFDGGERDFVEYMRYAFFATAGSWSPSVSGGAVDPFGNVPTLDATWRAPAEAGEVRIWIVQRDERGGTGWVELCVRVLP